MEWGPLADIAAAAHAIKHPFGLAQVPSEIPGPAFFPGGRGLVTADLRLGTELPVGGVMVVGHNYGTVDDHSHYTRLNGEAESNATWRGLRKVLSGARINLGDCFFTNAFVGLLPPGSNQGSHDGHSDPDFLAGCRRLMTVQIAELQQPALILTLGLVVPRFLASLSQELDGWREAQSYRLLDQAGPVVASASFGSHRATVVALTHPCRRHLNIRHRSYCGEEGEAAELAMLRDALAAASFPTRRQRGGQLA